MTTINYEIPFVKTYSAENSRDNLLEMFSSQNHNSRGTYSEFCELFLSRIHSGSNVFLTPSCSDALEFASQLIDLGPGDEVILPTFNFTSGANAIINFGATPIFVDIDKTGCIDVEKISEKVNSATRAISWVNYGGQVPNIRKLKEIALDHKIILIEDNAHSLGVHDGEVALGTIGDFSTTSFHYTKNIQCGEGGALIVNNPAYISRAHRIYEKGTNRHDFSSGRVSKYRWVDKGSSYVMSEFSAAILAGQFTEFESINAKRRKVINLYQEKLNELDELRDFRFPKAVENKFYRAAHLFPILFPDQSMRDFMAEGLKKRGIAAVSHYEALHSSPKALEILHNTSRMTPEEIISYLEQFEIGNEISAGILRLPLWPTMEQEHVERVIAALVETFEMY